MADLKSLLGEAYKEGMTAEEITKAFESLDIHAGYVKKDVFDKTASEAADWKKKHNALLSEEERKEAERLENGKKLEEELASLRQDKAISESKAKYLGLGYDEKLASETATAFVTGDMNTVFANMAKHQENHDKALKAQMLNNTPTPGAGNPGNVDYTKKIEEALASGNMADAVYYTTLAQTPTK
jgi:Fe-S cluster biosynthesis and repair protein YggX